MIHVVLIVLTGIILMQIYGLVLNAMILVKLAIMKDLIIALVGNFVFIEFLTDKSPNSFYIYKGIC